MGSGKQFKESSHIPDLRGFEEVLDLVGQSGRPMKKRGRTPQKGSPRSSLLEVEKIRLKKLQAFFNEKLPQMGQLSQQQNLYQKQWEHRAQLRTKLVQIMANERSLFQKYLQNFFDQIF